MCGGGPDRLNGSAWPPSAGSARFRSWPCAASGGAVLPAFSRAADPPDASAPSNAAGPVVCVEVPDGCVFCAGRDDQAPFLEADQSRPLLCDPKDDESCVEFCSAVTPACALPWSATKGCLVDTELEFRQRVFNLRTADRPEGVIAGRVVDEAGRRIEGARVQVWVTWGAEAGAGAAARGGHRQGWQLPHPAAQRALVVFGAGELSRAARRPSPIASRASVSSARRGRAPPASFACRVEQSIRGRVVDLATGLGVSG